MFFDGRNRHCASITPRHITATQVDINVVGKQPLASDISWPLVDGHDRQLSCWIFYTSTGSKWPVADRRYSAPTGCLPPRSGRSGEESHLRSRMTAFG